MKRAAQTFAEVSATSVNSIWNLFICDFDSIPDMNVVRQSEMNQSDRQSAGKLLEYSGQLLERMDSGHSGHSGHL